MSPCTARKVRSHLPSPSLRKLARCIALCLPAVSVPAGAATFTVTTNADTIGSGSLRDALIALNASTNAANTIQFDAGLSGQVITLGSPLPLILNNVTIDGTGVMPIVDGNSLYRIFLIGVDDPTRAALHTQFPAAPLGNRLQVTLRNINLDHGAAKGGSGGGGGMGAGGALFVNGAADVTLDGVGLFNNEAAGGVGGAISFGAFATLGGGGGMGGSSGHVTYAFNGGGGLFGNATLTGGGGVFGNGSAGGGGYTGDGGAATVAGAAGTRVPAGLSGSGGSGSAAGGASGGGGGGGNNSFPASGSGGGGFAGANGTSTDGGNGGFGGGGGGGGLVGGKGGFGGGGGGGIDNNVGGDYGQGSGGFGGGGGTCNGHGGDGGFGGGGADGYSGGGTGGFGGGGGGHIAGSAGTGGFGGGNGSTNGGGGGAGFGGAIFVSGGGTITFTGASVAEVADSTSAGPPATGATAGATAGSGVFLQGNGTLKFSPASGQTDALFGYVDDESGSGITPPSGYVPGNWGLQKDGAGMLFLGAPSLNGFTGATVINSGVVLDLVGGSSPVTVNANGVLAGLGDFPSVTNAGTLVPGDSNFPQANFAVENTLTMQTGSVACFHAGAAPTSSSITVFGTANLGGVARIDFATAPSVGNSFVIINGATINGTFGGFATNLSGIDGRLNYTPTQVTFSVTALDGIFRDTFEGGSNDTPCALAVPPT